MSKDESPLGLAQEVARLMKLPQHLCKQRGICCRVATFKGSLNVEAIRVIAAETSIEGEMARDFLSIFIPYGSQAEAEALAPVFVERVRERARDNGQVAEAVAFFHCRYVQADGRCGVHEDRPVGCRTYPFPHERTLYHPGCGFERQGQINWQKIQTILTQLGISIEGDKLSTGDAGGDGRANPEKGP